MAQAMQARKKKEDEDKQFLAQSRATEAFLKANPDIFAKRDAQGNVIPDSGQAVIDQLTAVDPNETPAQRNMRLNQFVKMGVAGQDIAKSQAEVQTAKAIAQFHSKQTEQLAGELKRRDDTDAIMRNPIVLETLKERDPYKTYAVAVSMGADPKILQASPFIAQELQNRTKEEIAAAGLEGRREAERLRAELADAKASAAPKGYRWKQGPNQELEPIPGSAEELAARKTEQEMAINTQKEAEKAQMATRREEMFKADVAETLANIQKAKALVMQGAGGKIDTAAAVVGLAPKTDALKSLYNSVRAAQLVNKLTELKSLSPSGASGAGQLSDKEGAAFASTVSELDPGKPEDFQLERLNNLEKYLRKMSSGTPAPAQNIIQGEGMPAPVSPSMPAMKLPPGWKLKG